MRAHHLAVRPVFLWISLVSLVFLGFWAVGRSLWRPAPSPAESAAGPLPVASLRKFPYPWRAGLAISGDVDSCSRQEYLEVHQFLNTKEDTAKNIHPERSAGLGVGVGLEVGDSFWMFTDVDTGGWTFSYFQPNSSTKKSGEADLIRTWGHAGYADILHSFADMTQAGSFNRQMAQAGLAEMRKAHLAPMVFVNHGNTSNTNNVTAPWKGDLPGAAEHHTDLSVYPAGPFRFISTGKCLQTFGFNPLEPLQLRDGRAAYAFPRYFDAREGWNVEFLGRQLSSAHLDALTRNEAYWIVAQHLGFARTLPMGNMVPVFNAEGVQALRDLERRYRAGQIYVTTVAKLLWYNYVHRNLEFMVTPKDDGGLTVAIKGVNDPIFGFFVPTVEQLAGITFYTSIPEKTTVRLGDADVTAQLQVNPHDGRGWASLSFPLIPLPPLPEWTSDGYTRKTEQYQIEEYNYTFSVTNLGAEAFRPSLSYTGLHPFSVREARVGALHLIDAPPGEPLVRLPRLRAGQKMEGITVLNGPWNPAIPRLIAVTGNGATVANATYHAPTGRIAIELTGEGAASLTLGGFKAGRRYQLRNGDAVTSSVFAGPTGEIALTLPGRSGRVFEIKAVSE